MRTKATVRGLLSLLLAAALLLALPVFALADETEDDTAPEAAEAAESTENTEDTDETDCSITLHFTDDSLITEETEGITEDIALRVQAQQTQELIDTEVTVNVYRLADALPIEGSDGYTFEMLDPYTALTISDDLDSEAVIELAAQAEELAVSAVPSTAAVKEAGKNDLTVEGLKAGLYLVLVSSAGNESGTVTSTSYSYTFSPILVSLPTKTSASGGIAMTSDPGDWIYNAEVHLKDKYDVENRLGCIIIHKTFTSLPVASVTCVFDVEAVLNGENVFSNVYSMYFDGTTTEQELLITGLPVGATVTVSETYVTPGYKLLEIVNRVIVVTQAGDTAAQSSGTVLATNTPGGNDFVFGGSVTNHYYTYEDETGATVTETHEDATHYWRVEQQISSVSR